jgi:hypothetical protein
VLLELLREGGRTLAELAAALTEREAPADQGRPIPVDDVIAAVRLLDRQGLLEDGDRQGRLGADEQERYFSNLAFFESFASLARGREEFHEMLRGAHVLVLGTGGLNSNTIPHLCGLGVGRLTLLDRDMAIDTVWLGAALGLRLANREGALALPGLLDRLAAALALALTYGVVWQFAAIFMRSDMHAVLANALRCNDLYRATWLTTKNRLWRLTQPEAEKLRFTGDHDRRVARWFGIAYLAGMIIVGWTVLTYGVPFAIGMLLWTKGSLTSPNLISVTFWESVGVTLVVVGQLAAPPLLALRERRQRRTRGLR